MIKRKRKINKQRILANIDMRVRRWLGHPVYIALRNKYGTLKAVEMMDDAAKCKFFSVSAASHHSLVTWSDTSYCDDWVNLEL